MMHNFSYVIVSDQSIILHDMYLEAHIGREWLRKGGFKDLSRSTP